MQDSQHDSGHSASGRLCALIAREDRINIALDWQFYYGLS